MLKMSLAALAAIALTACIGLNTVADKGALLSDEVREGAEFALCRGITVGAWVRAYASSPERAQAWRTLCSQTLSETPAKPR